MDASSLVIIPTYNECENVESIIRAVQQLPVAFDVLIVDDSSPDGTHTIVQKLQEEFTKTLHLIVREEKNGLGKAYLSGFDWALKNNYHYIFQMDADFSHNPKDLLRMRNVLDNDEAEMVIGSRYIEGINVVNWPLKRILLSYGASWYVRLITRMKIYDPTAGFVGYKASTLKHILNQYTVRFVGYAFQIEMKYYCFVEKMRLKEISIIFKDRTKGVSKMNIHIIREAIFGVLQLKINSLKKYLFR